MMTLQDDIEDILNEMRQDTSSEIRRLVEQLENLRPDRLIKTLESPRKNIKRNLEIITKYFSPLAQYKEFWPFFIKMLSEDDPNVQKIAVTTLLPYIQNIDIQDAFVNVVRDYNVGKRVVNALSPLAENNVALRKSMVNTFLKSTWPIDEETAKSLSKLVRIDFLFKNELINKLKDQNRKTKLRSAKILSLVARSDQLIQNEFLPLLDDEFDELCAQVVKALAFLVPQDENIKQKFFNLYENRKGVVGKEIEVGLRSIADNDPAFEKYLMDVFFKSPLLKILCINTLLPLSENHTNVKKFFLDKISDKDIFHAFVRASINDQEIRGAVKVISSRY